jgi:hypothetical protein
MRNERFSVRLSPRETRAISSILEDEEDHFSIENDDAIDRSFSPTPHQSLKGSPGATRQDRPVITTTTLKSDLDGLMSRIRNATGFSTPGALHQKAPSPPPAPHVTMAVDPSPRFPPTRGPASRQRNVVEPVYERGGEDVQAELVRLRKENLALKKELFRTEKRIELEEAEHRKLVLAVEQRKAPSR